MQVTGKSLWAKEGNPRWLRPRNGRKVGRKSGRQAYRSHQSDAVSQSLCAPTVVTPPQQATSQWLVGAVVSVANRTRGRHQNYISQKSIRGRPTFLNVKFGVIKKYHHFRANLKIRFSSFQEHTCVLSAVLALSVDVAVYFTSSLLFLTLSRECKRQGMKNAFKAHAPCSLSRMRSNWQRLAAAPGLGVCR